MHQMEKKFQKNSYKFAVKESRLAKGPRGRLVYMSIKNQVKGHVNKLVMNYNFPNGEMPPVMKKVAGASESFKKKYPYFLKHLGEEIHALPGGELKNSVFISRLKNSVFISPNSFFILRPKLSTGSRG